jgi:hypothetical protein
LPSDARKSGDEESASLASPAPKERAGQTRRPATAASQTTRNDLKPFFIFSSSSVLLWLALDNQKIT